MIRHSKFLALFTLSAALTSACNPLGDSTVVGKGLDDPPPTRTPTAPGDDLATVSLTSPTGSFFVSNASTLNLAGTCIAGDVVHLRGDFNDTTICAAGGTFTFSASQSIDGYYIATLYQEDPTTSRLSPPVGIVWQRKSVIAAPSIVTPPSLSYRSAESSITVSGQCEGGASVVLSGAASASTTCSSLAYSFSVAKGSDGTYGLTVTQTDIAGNSASRSMTWTKQALAVSPASVNTVASTSPTVLTVTGGSGLGYSFALQSNNSGSSLSSINSVSTSYTPGPTYNVTDIIRVTDSIGEFVDVPVRVSPPATAPTVTTPATSPYLSAQSSITIGGACFNGNTVNLSGDSTQSVGCSGGVYSFSVTKASDGNYSFIVSQTDVFSNVSASTTRAWNKHAVLVTSNTSPLPSSGTASLSASGGTGSYTFSILTNHSGGSFGSSTTASPISYTAGPDGAVTDTIRCTDSLGYTYDLNLNIAVSPISGSWTFAAGSDSQYTFDPSKIELVGGVARLIGTSAFRDHDNTASGFGGSTLTGVGWDVGSNTLRLANAGGCDATTANCATLDASWTPQWGSLAGYWNLNEPAAGLAPGGADVTDGSGNANHGTAGGGATLGVRGRVVRGADLNGGNGFFTAPASPTLNTTGSELTVSGWVYPKNANVAGFVVERNGCAPSFNWQFYTQDGTNNMNFMINGNGYAATFYCSAPSPDLNKWSHLVATYSGSSITLYVNGQAVTTCAASGALQGNSDNLVIGSDTCGQGVPGTIDEVAIWNKALSASEVQVIYARQSMSMGAEHLGFFDSRILDAGSSSPWPLLSWTPTLPFGKELPSNGVSESSTAYSDLASSSLMSGIIGLWHLNETSTASAPGGADFKDDSGSGNHGTAAGGVSFGTDGKLNSAALFDGSSGTVNLSTAISAGTNMTYSAWVNANDVSDSPVLGTSGTVCYLLLFSGGSQLYAGACTGIEQVWWPITGSQFLKQWNHLAISKTGSTLELYINGVSQGTRTLSQLTPVSNIGFGQSEYFNGSIDEVAIWGRALSATEIQQLYWRGANRIKYQVRSCAIAGCADSPAWRGPDNTGQSYFSELNNNSLPSSGLGDVFASLPSMLFSSFSGLTVSNSRYFQYRAIMESDDTNVSNGPALRDVAAGVLSYDSSAPTIYGNTGVQFYGLTSFAQTLGSGGCAGTPRFVLSLDKVTWYYWSGAAWATANGTYAQANVATDISAHATSFESTVGRGTVYFKAFLKSDGSTACEIDQLDLGATR